MKKKLHSTPHSIILSSQQKEGGATRNIPLPDLAYNKECSLNGGRDFPTSTEEEFWNTIKGGVRKKYVGVSYVRKRLQPPFSDCADGCFYPRSHLQLGKDAFQVLFNGFFADTKLQADLLVGFSGNNCL